MEGLTSCLSDMIDSMKEAQSKLDSDAFSMGDFLQQAGIVHNQPTVVMGKKQYACDLCGRRFSDLSNLRRHKHIHEDIRPYACDVCGSRFHQKTHVERHQLVHTGERPFQCSYCLKGFRDSTELKLHLRVHTGERPYSCPVCKKTFSRICYMKRHQEKHLSIVPTAMPTNENKDVAKEYLCSFCRSWFFTKQELEDHRSVHLKHGPAGQKLYECTQCKKCFTGSSNLRKHAVIHTGLRPFTCNLCNQSFRQATHLQRHRLIHTGEKPFKCSICLKGVRDASELVKHQRVHRGNAPRRRRSVKNLTHVTNPHIELRIKEEVVSEDIPLPASHSDHSIKSENDVEESESNCLLGEPPSDKTCKDDVAEDSEQILHCSLCSRTFTQIAGLHRHYLLHTGFRPFSCPVCSKTFQQMSQLERHKQVHGMEQQHDSTTSPEPVQESSDLLRPKQARKKGKFYSCNMCDKMYTRMHYLESHQRSHEQQSMIANGEGSSIEVVLM